MLRRRKSQESYWYLPEDSNEFDCIGQINNPREWRKLPDVKQNRNSEIRISLEHAIELQSKWTSWPSSIWELNLDDADGEIVFDDRLSDDYSPSESSGKKSVGTLDTEDSLPSSCSTPEFQDTWEHHDLDLSAIVDEDFPEQDEDEDEVSTNTLDAFDACALSGCSAAVPLPLPNSSHGSCSPSNQFLIEEPLETLGSILLQQSSATAGTKKTRRRKQLRFADEEGKAMETVHFVNHGDECDETMKRLLILMLLPKTKCFEFVHAEYSTKSDLTVSALLKQLPRLASDPTIKKQKYRRLCRAAGGSELVNALTIQSYDLPTDEILVAVLKDYTGETMHKMAKTLVENEKILRAVKRTNQGAHTLHRLEGRRGRKTRTSNTQKKDRCRYSPSQLTSHVGVFNTIVVPALHHSPSAELRVPPPKQIPLDDTSLHEVSLEDESNSAPRRKPAIGRQEHTVQQLPGKAKQPKIHNKIVRAHPRTTNLGDDAELTEGFSQSKPEHKHAPRKEQTRPPNFFGRKMFQRKQLPSNAELQSKDTTYFGKSFFQRIPSPRKVVQPSKESEDSGGLRKTLFRWKTELGSFPDVLQRQQSPSSKRVHPSNPSKGGATSTSAPWTGWGKLKINGTRTSDDLAVKQ